MSDTDATQARHDDAAEAEHPDFPILRDIEYVCPIDGMRAAMDRFYGGPAYAHHWHYAIKCTNPSCPNHTADMKDWRDTPYEALRHWNRRTA